MDNNDHVFVSITTPLHSTPKPLHSFERPRERKILFGSKSICNIPRLIETGTSGVHLSTRILIPRLFASEATQSIIDFRLSLTATRRRNSVCKSLSEYITGVTYQSYYFKWFTEKTEGFRLASKKYSGATAGSSLNFFQQLGAGC
ncbi:MAG: hypothetical protein AB2695_15050, partial [Candidatus Thiodiazotropha endolucinida]